jgi:adenylate cyclase
MTPRPTSERWWLWGLVVAALAWCAALVLPYLDGRATFIDPLEYRLLDARYTITGPTVQAPEVVVVAIDDAVLDAVQDGATGRRALLAAVITHIAQSGARTLALDVLLADAGVPDEDAALASALETVPSVIAAAVAFSEDAPQAARLIWPQDVFAEAAEAGLVNLSTDAGGVPRYLPLLISADGAFMPSFPLLAALSFTGENAAFEADHAVLAGRHIPLDDRFHMPLRMLGPTGTVPTYSARPLLDGPQPEFLADKLVLLGYTASATGDRFPTPYSEDTPGVEVLAGAVSQLIGGDTLRRDQMTRRWDAAHAVVLTLAVLLVMCLLPLSRGAVVTLVLFAVSATGLTVAFAYGVWLGAALPWMAAGPSALAAGILRYGVERRKAEHSERTVASLRRFQSATLSQRFEENPDYLAAPHVQELAIFFVDLTGFTGLSQRLGADGTRQLLGQFHEVVSDKVEVHQGCVFNYMGDGVMAVFGLDEATERLAADRALDAAFDLVRSLAATRLPQVPEEQLSCRIGLHKGPATLSRLGAERYQQVTATGDTVNLSSRLMEVAKAHGAVIAASDDFCRDLNRPDATGSARSVDVPIRGRTGRVVAWLWTMPDVRPEVSESRPSATI